MGYKTLILLVGLGLMAALVFLIQWRADAHETAAEAAYPPSGQLINLGGVTVHVRVMGAGPDLVLIHGASGNLNDFTFDLTDRLKDRYRVILFDRPGLGWTERLPGFGGTWSDKGESPQEQAALLQQAADTLGVENPIVLGHSYGGAVALAWALARPDETAALVLVSAVSEPWPGNLGWLYTVTGSGVGGALVIPVLTAFTPKFVIDASISQIFKPQPVPRGYGGHIGPELVLRRSSMRANAQQVNTLRPHIVEMSQYYSTLTMPVEVIHGTADTIVPAHIHAEKLVTQLPDANLTLLEGMGHMPHHAQAARIVELIERAAANANLRRAR